VVIPSPHTFFCPPERISEALGARITALCLVFRDFSLEYVRAWLYECTSTPEKSRLEKTARFAWQTISVEFWAKKSVSDSIFTGREFLIVLITIVLTPLTY
jgi:hypothetical protein